MKKLTGLDYLKIDIANSYGLDKLEWVERLLWFELHVHELDKLVVSAEEPMNFIKAVEAYKATMQGIPVNHIMYLDATASGLQLLAALSGCHITAKAVNLINTGKREDVYSLVRDKCNTLLPQDRWVSRKDIKKPTMTHFYGKMSQNELGGAEDAFYQTINALFPGADAVKETITSMWNKDAYEHTFTLPDGHVAKIPVIEGMSKRIEVDELNHSSFTYGYDCNTPSFKSSSLCPNVIHAIDAYIVREMIRRAAAIGFQIAPIHDAFGAHPNNMQKVRELYRDIMVEIAEMDLLQDICRELSGTMLHIDKHSNDLGNLIKDSEYMLS